LSYISWLGTSLINPYPIEHKHIILAHPLVPDALILAQFQSEPYNRSLVGFPASDGRSRTGGIRVKGDRYAPQPEWDFNLSCKTPQLYLFEQLLYTQSLSVIPITFTDNFAGTGAATVFVDVDGRYSTPATTIDLWKLQFKLSKEV
jgi:hypothetical protein